MVVVVVVVVVIQPAQALDMSGTFSFNPACFLQLHLVIKKLPSSSPKIRPWRYSLIRTLVREPGFPRLACASVCLSGKFPLVVFTRRQVSHTLPSLFCYENIDFRYLLGFTKVYLGNVGNRNWHFVRGVRFVDFMFVFARIVIVKIVENPPDPACQGHQGCGFRCSSPFNNYWSCS